MTMKCESRCSATGWGMLLALHLSAFAPAAAAIETVVTATFAPNALNPGHNQFTNTTTPGIYCQWRPASCSAANAYFFDVPLVLTKTYVKGDDIRKRFYVHLPAPRDATITHLGSGRDYPVTLAFQAFSGHLSPGTNSPVFTAVPRGGCSYIHTAGHGGWVRFGWLVRTPQAPTACHSNGDSGPVGFTGDFRSSWFGLGMQITAPAPLGMPSGEYEGRVTYTLGGAGSDIDFGDDVTVEPEMTLVLKFSVAHAFNVTFPSQSPSARLAPDGGWAQWIDHGKAPARLHQTLPFHLTSSMDFSMKLRCEHDAPGDRCGIQNANDDVVVPVDVDVTLPGMTNLHDGRPAQFTPLTSLDANAPRFSTQSYLQERRSTLRFMAGQAAVTEMLKSPGSQWQGDVTIVFDANP